MDLFQHKFLFSEEIMNPVFRDFPPGYIAADEESALHFVIPAVFRYAAGKKVNNPAGSRHGSLKFHRTPRVKDPADNFFRQIKPPSGETVKLQARFPQEGLHGEPGDQLKRFADENIAKAAVKTDDDVRA